MKCTLMLLCFVHSGKGLDAARIQLVLSDDEMKWIKIKRDSLEMIAQRKYNKLREILYEIQKITNVDIAIKKQWEGYILYILLSAEKKEEEAYESIANAISCTLGNPFLLDMKNNHMSSDEIQLYAIMVMKGYQLKKIQKYQAKSLFDQLFLYIDQKILDGFAKATIMSKLLGIEYIICPNWLKKEQIDKAIYLLVHWNIIYDLPILLEIKEKLNGNDHNQAREHKEVLMWLMKNFYKEYRLIPDLIYMHEPQLYSIRSFLVNGREEKNYSQEEISYGICSPPSYSKIESGKHEVRKRNMGRILDKLDLSWGYYNGIVLTDKYEVVLKRIALEEEWIDFDYRRCNEKIEDLEMKLDLTIPQNLQYCGRMKVKYRLETKDILPEEAIKELWNLLSLTRTTKKTTRAFSPQETAILYELAKIYRCYLKQPNEALKIVNLHNYNKARNMPEVEMQDIFFQRILAGIYCDLARWPDEKMIAEKNIIKLLSQNNALLICEFLDLLAEGTINCAQNESEKKAATRLLVAAYYMADLYQSKQNAVVLKNAYESYQKKQICWDLD